MEKIAKHYGMNSASLKLFNFRQNIQRKLVMGHSYEHCKLRINASHFNGVTQCQKLKLILTHARHSATVCCLWNLNRNLVEIRIFTIHTIPFYKTCLRRQFQNSMIEKIWISKWNFFFQKSRRNFQDCHRLRLRLRQSRFRWAKLFACNDECDDKCCIFFDGIFAKFCICVNSNLTLSW